MKLGKSIYTQEKINRPQTEGEFIFEAGLVSFCHPLLCPAAGFKIILCGFT